MRCAVSRCLVICVISLSTIHAAAAAKWMAPSSKLTPSDAAVEKRFGQSVAISGTTVIAGAPQDHTLDFVHGAAYAFQLQPTGEWQETEKLISAQPRNNHLFGDSVAISEDTAVIGTHGEYASVFQRTSGTAWEEVIWLTPGPIWDSQSGDGFGWSVDLAADLAIVGAPNAEAAYIFDRHSGGTSSWGQVAKLTPVGGSDPLHFGRSVAISDDMAIVGSRDRLHRGELARRGFEQRRSIRLQLHEC